RFSADGKGELTKWNQDMRTAVTDAPTMCSFIFDMAVIGIAAQNTADLMDAVTGISYTPDDVLLVGERINNLARAFNVREGFTRADDTLPERLLTEPIPGGASKGHYITKEELKQMLDEYYAARGWDVETGSPTRENLTALNLEYVANELKL
ncbi:MAG: aldehyde ferredoxin oxidoreductase C-terminal domain-containing protein, partial [Desulfobacterales bacterium]|nr:aldehyde ferredoxin oxidoreductase C-terminal domain-containing protein [Desulfobacterales bacterium]